MDAEASGGGGPERPGSSGERSRAGCLLLLATIIGLLLAAFAMYAAWDHNPQGEFHEDGVVHWSAWLTVGLLWFAAPFLPAALIYLVDRRGRRKR